MSDPLSNADATLRINEVAKLGEFSLVYKLHAKEQMADRNIITSDVLFVLKNGFVRKPPQSSTRSELFKYLVESKTPNSDSREIRVVAIPDFGRKMIKLVTIMWVDESGTRTGSLISGEEQ